MLLAIDYIVVCLSQPDFYILWPVDFMKAYQVNCLYQILQRVYIAISKHTTSYNIVKIH